MQLMDIFEDVKFSYKANCHSTKYGRKMSSKFVDDVTKGQMYINSNFSICIYCNVY